MIGHLRVAGAGAVLFLAATPALADGFNLTQLLGYGFRVGAATTESGPRAAGRFEVLYLQGRLPGGAQDAVMRCVARAEPQGGDSNCWQVY